jgi:hypothetical protein
MRYVPVEEDWREVVAAARRLVDAGEGGQARDVLLTLVGRVDGRTPAALLRSCAEVAADVPAPDLELHFALWWWREKPGLRAAREALLQAAARHEHLRKPAFRIARRRGRVEDWAAIAAADVHGSWPEVAALGSDGVHGERTLEELRADGSLTVAGSEGRPAAWVLRDARVTRTRRAVAVGAYQRDRDGRESMRYVPALSSWDCAAALGWSAAGAAGARRGRVVLLTTQFSFSGYWLWMFEGLLPVVRLDDEGVLAAGDRLVVCQDRPPIRAVLDSLAAAGLDRVHVELTGEDFDVRVEELVVPVRHHDAGGIVERGAPETVEEIMAERSRHDHVAEIRSLHRRLGLVHSAPHPGKRRLLVSRRDASSRRVSNEPELQALLEPAGFETVVLGELSFREQVAAFAEAEMVIAPHGAALANLLFAAPGTVVVELHQAGAERPHYKQLATRLDLRHLELSCDADPRSREDMVVDVGVARSLVFGALGERPSV